MNFGTNSLYFMITTPLNSKPTTISSAQQLQVASGYCNSPSLDSKINALDCALPLLKRKSHHTIFYIHVLDLILMVSPTT